MKLSININKRTISTFKWSKVTNKQKKLIREQWSESGSGLSFRQYKKIYKDQANEQVYKNRQSNLYKKTREVSKKWEKDLELPNNARRNISDKLEQGIAKNKSYKHIKDTTMFKINEKDYKREMNALNRYKRQNANTLSTRQLKNAFGGKITGVNGEKISTHDKTGSMILQQISQIINTEDFYKDNYELIEDYNKSADKEFSNEGKALKIIYDKSASESSIKDFQSSAKRERDYISLFESNREFESERKKELLENPAIFRK